MGLISFKVTGINDSYDQTSNDSQWVLAFTFNKLFRQSASFCRFFRSCSATIFFEDTLGDVVVKVEEPVAEVAGVDELFGLFLTTFVFMITFSLVFILWDFLSGDSVSCCCLAICSSLVLVCLDVYKFGRVISAKLGFWLTFLNVVFVECTVAATTPPRVIREGSFWGATVLIGIGTGGLVIFTDKFRNDANSGADWVTVAAGWVGGGGGGCGGSGSGGFSIVGGGNGGGDEVGNGGGCGCSRGSVSGVATDSSGSA